MSNVFRLIHANATDDARPKTGDSDYNTVLERVKQFKYLGRDISYERSNDVKGKLNEFTHICGTINRILKIKIRDTNKIL